MDGNAFLGFGAWVTGFGRDRIGVELEKLENAHQEA